MKKCPYCAEEIQEKAIKCRFCGEWFIEKSQLPFQENSLHHKHVYSVNRIKIIGVGGAGGNIINRIMIESNYEGIEFIAINTDDGALYGSQATTKLSIGTQTTCGRGAGVNPEVGKKAAKESTEEIIEVLKGVDMVFIIGGLGGGTGTGSIPVIAEIAKSLGAVVIVVGTKPFTFEGDRRKDIAERGVEEIKEICDIFFIYENDSLLGSVDKNTPLLEAFSLLDKGVLQIIDTFQELGLDEIKKITLRKQVLNIDICSLEKKELHSLLFNQ